jgi:hypothetical protein
MACYAMACHQRHPCASVDTCQRVWHACIPPSAITGHIVWICRECKAIWHLTDDTWWRDPLKRP